MKTRTRSSKRIAVARAVDEQLTADNRPPPHDLDKVMRADYRYRSQTIGTYMAGVQTRLENGTPKYVFDYPNDFPDDELDKTVAAMTADINDLTTEAASASRRRKAPVTTGTKRTKQKETTKTAKKRSTAVKSKTTKKKPTARTPGRRKQASTQRSRSSRRKGK